MLSTKPKQPEIERMVCGCRYLRVLLPWRCTIRRHVSHSSRPEGRNPVELADLASFEVDRIRNFSIIAHVDHGKSTLADRILEQVQAISKSSDNKQVLDRLQVERERGITVKAQTVTVLYHHPHRQQPFLFNLIDTPGHVDFSSEVTRSLPACQGVILLVDANQGVQAQTVSNFYMAFANDLAIIPVLNKIDLPNAQPETVKRQLRNLFDIDPKSVLEVSAKRGDGVAELLEAVVDRVPPPSCHGRAERLKLFLQDSWYDKYRGNVMLVQVFDGRIRCGDEISSCLTGSTYTVKTVGILTPQEFAVPCLYPGQVGVVTCGMKSAKEAIIGDTFHHRAQPVDALMEVQRPKSMVFAGFYPFNSSEHAKLKGAIEKVGLNDYSVHIEAESSPALGMGWRLGFLGLLHLEVFSQRLRDEYNADVIVTTPSVPFKLLMKPHAVKDWGESVLIRNPANWLSSNLVESYMEPYVRGTIICPSEYTKDVIGLTTDYRGFQPHVDRIDDLRDKIEVTLPLCEIVTDFFNDLKALTSGFGSFDYEDAGFQPSEIVLVDILLNDEKVSELSFISHVSNARVKGSQVCRRLKDTLQRQLFAVKIQAAIQSKILAREDLKAYRKDVTAKCYGGDMTRKMKLLRNQAEGKKRLKAIGKIDIDKDTFIQLLNHKRD